MFKENKFTIYIKHLILMSTVNKVRIILTAIGIFIAVIIFAIGIISTNSYYQKELSIIEEIQRNTIAIDYDNCDRKHLTELVNLSGVIPIEDVMITESKSILSNDIGNGRYCNILAKFHGLNNLSEISPMTSTQENVYISANTILKEGRLFTNTDIQEKNRVVIIDEITAQLLFPNENALEKTITIGTGINDSFVSKENTINQTYLKFKIIGIVESNSIMKERLMVFKKTLNYTENDVFFETQVYCPISIINEYFKNDETINYMVFTFVNQKEYKRAVSSIDSFIEAKSNFGIRMSYTTYENQKDILEEELQHTKIVLNLITIFLCVISGISIMSITFFSIKERIPEIGVRKAFGATNIDIVTQFIFEMVSIALITSMVATCFSVLIVRMLSMYLYESLYIIFPMSIETRHLLLPILVGVLEAVVCSVPPSLYAAKIEVTDALRFE